MKFKMANTERSQVVLLDNHDNLGGFSTSEALYLVLCTTITLQEISPSEFSKILLIKSGET